MQNENPDMRRQNQGMANSPSGAATTREICELSVNLQHVVSDCHLTATRETAGSLNKGVESYPLSSRPTLVFSDLQQTSH